jgi:hypothetical protein
MSVQQLSSDISTEYCISESLRLEEKQSTILEAHPPGQQYSLLSFGITFSSDSVHAQATEPFMAKMVVSEERFGSVPKDYIRTAIDKMVSPILQDEILQNTKVDQVRILQAGHFPTLSVPETLAGQCNGSD